MANQNFEQILIWIMFTYYLFTVVLMFYMFKKRKNAIKAREVKFSHFKAYQGDTTEELTVIQNHFNNQFQIPMVFLVICTLAISLHRVDQVFLIIAILFVASRLVHSYVHLGPNIPMRRALAYFVGVILLIGMWIRLLL